MPESHDDTLDLSIKPPTLAAVAANEDSAWKFRTAARFNTAVKRGDAAARDIVSAPRPQDGTLDFGIAPALPAAMTTRAVSAEHSSTAASDDTAVTGSDMVARDLFSTPRAQAGTLEFGFTPASPLL